MFQRLGEGGDITVKEGGNASYWEGGGYYIWGGMFYGFGGEVLIHHIWGKVGEVS